MVFFIQLQQDNALIKHMIVDHKPTLVIAITTEVKDLTPTKTLT